jgi:uncharacterized integral membrane protein (TIGR00697 family)
MLFYRLLSLAAINLFLNAEIIDGFKSKTSKMVSMAQRGESIVRFSNKRMRMVATEDFENTVIAQDVTPQVIRAASDMPPYSLNKQQFIYVVLTSIFISCLLVADVIGVKLFEFKLPFPILGHSTIEHTCGMLTFPITFLLGDTINEYYGAKATRQTVYIGLAMSILVFGVINLAQVLPYLDKPFNVSRDAFDMIFGSAKLMYIASITAYLIGQLSDIWLFGVIKRFTKGQYLWLRATGSTLVSQMLDSFVVSYVAFSLGKALTGQTPASIPEVFDIAVTGYGLKFFISAVMTPFLYGLRYVMHNYFGLEPLPVDYDESKD